MTILGQTQRGSTVLARLRGAWETNKTSQLSLLLSVPMGTSALPCPLWGRKAVQSPSPRAWVCCCSRTKRKAKQNNNIQPGAARDQEQRLSSLLPSLGSKYDSFWKSWHESWRGTGLALYGGHPCVPIEHLSSALTYQPSHKVYFFQAQHSLPLLLAA